MSSQIKFRVTQKGGKSVKFGRDLIEREKFHLGQPILGIASPFWLEFTDTGVWMKSDRGNSIFFINGQSVCEAKLAVNDKWEWRGVKIEFLIVPEPMTVATDSDSTQYIDATRFLDRKTVTPPAATSQSAASTVQKTKLPEKPTLKEGELTSMIFKMKIPEKISEPTSMKARMQAYDVPYFEKEKKEWKRRIRVGWELLGRKFPVLRHPHVQKGVIAGFCVAIGLVAFWPKKNMQPVAVVPPVDTTTALTATNSAPAVPAGTVPAVALSNAGVPGETPNAANAAANPAAVPPPAQPGASGLGTAPAAAALDGKPTAASDGSPDFDPISKEEYFSAVKTNDFGLVRYLVEKRLVDVNFSLEAGKTALHVAAAKGYLPIAKYLLSKQANINARDPGGATPLLWAVFKRQEKMARYLVKHGADKTIAREGGDRPIDIAKRYGLRSYYSFLQVPKSGEPGRDVAGVKHGKKSRKKHKVVEPSEEE